MSLAVFSTKPYDRAFLDRANEGRGLDLNYFEARLDRSTVELAQGAEAVCVFVNDQIDAVILDRLAGLGVGAVLLRCAGFNNIDLAAAESRGIAVARVAAYSPHAVAEFSIGLLLAVTRNLHRGWARVRDDNFSLAGLTGRNLHGRTAGVVGTGAIGAVVARILLQGFGCEVIAHDPAPDPHLRALGVRYVALPELLAGSDIISLHCPLVPGTRPIIDAAAIAMAKPGFVLVNTARGGLVDTAALIDGLKSGRVGAAALDVYEREGPLFFEDHSSQVVDDDLFQRLLTFPNVLVTGHQAFLSEEALAAIAETTLDNFQAWKAGLPMASMLSPGDRTEPPRR